MSKNKDLKQLLEDYRTEYESAARRGREAYIATLPAGTPTPAEGKIYDDYIREDFESKCYEIREKAGEIIGQQRDRLAEVVTAAPSEEAINVLQALKMRGNITGEELATIANRYGGNYQTAKVIESIATENKIYGFNAGSGSVDAQIETLEGLASSFSDANISAAAAERGRAGAFLSLIGQQIDSVFPED